MYRLIVFVLAIATAVGATLGVSAGVGEASALRDALTERFRVSRIDVQGPAVEGHVVTKGTVLRLRHDGVPANVLRSIQANTKSPRFHVRDYARVEVRQDGLHPFAPGVLSLTKGTQIVILDVKVDADRVRLFTHTLEPVPMPSGRAGYGCTEFVFVFDPDTLQRADVGTVANRIDEWLAVSAG